MIDLAPLIEHSKLSAGTTPHEIEILCQEAIKHQFHAVCVNPVYVALAKEHLKGSNCSVVTVVGFPLGASLTGTKVKETEEVIALGADEIDMVIDIGALKGGDEERVYQDIASVVKASQSNPVKVILEMSLLNKEQKIMGCQCAEKGGAQFVKTSTGFSTGGATVEDVRLVQEVVGTRLGIKAAGGIHDFSFAKELVEAGATRIGSSSSVAIVS